jgi:inorganic phosphate transporter, PiT family
MEILFFLSVVLLAAANGANDNFKGMATLWGSGTLSYSSALLLANVMTLLGSVLALVLGGALLQTFSGKGIIDVKILNNPAFALSFATGAGVCVLLATVTRFPISTTHAILGALTGAGVFFAGGEVQYSVLAQKGFVPLAISPLLAIGLTWLLWQMRGIFMLFPVQRLQALSAGVVRRFNVQDCAHVVSGSVVCLARGVNDTPKIASIFLISGALVDDQYLVFAGIGGFMVLGSVLLSRRVAQVISHEITGMSAVEGLGGNLVTAFLVLMASVFGFGVSTTHVSVGALFGIGVMNRRAHRGKIMEILLAWVLTLPVAFVIAYGTAFIIVNL